MTLVIETGTGLEDAEAYVPVDALRTYAAGRGVDLTEFDDTACEIKLRLAAQWIDTRWRYKGTRVSAGQALEFPRNGLADWSGFILTGVPKRVKDAACELAIRGLQGATLVPDLDRSGWIKSESVGPISTTYADGAPQSTVFAVAERLLEQFARDPEQQWAPFFGGSTTPLFERGMMSNPPSSLSDDD
ncbi:hypothetical protein KL86PLE_100242 [uncultured Pleomorphomonas sp.]|uniref:Putative DnaT-like domain-containing protein n=1 Tax=uncultured Pleomorphomonas sp. TaxID=442121 RepID=A0A212L1T1_9HYPH|nr:DnaT-like ssDNA-binding protein [uncultured Pleomorphomonas sp.]SCM71505.1 hypothetical protein KL86PLE_100242 [uncultured Pleomorphomonas sp.]